jgi:aminoglycoside phosphotransferase
MKKATKVNAKRVAAKVGAGVTVGIAGAIAAGYLLYKKTKPQQKKAAAWVIRARIEAARQAKTMGRIGQAEYHRIVEKAMKHYAAFEKVSAPELENVIDDAKSEWKHIQAEVKKANRKPAVKKKAAKMPKRKPISKKKKKK